MIVLVLMVLVLVLLVVEEPVQHLSGGFDMCCNDESSDSCTMAVKCILCGAGVSASGVGRVLAMFLVMGRYFW